MKTNEMAVRGVTYRETDWIWQGIKKFLGYGSVYLFMTLLAAL